jgi:hypothetical protein
MLLDMLLQPSGSHGKPNGGSDEMCSSCRGSV